MEAAARVIVSEARGEGGGGSEAAMRAMGSKKRRGASAHEIHLACAC